MQHLFGLATSKAKLRSFPSCSLPVRSPTTFFKQCSSRRAARPPGHPRTRARLANAQRFPGRALGWTCWLLSARRSEPSGQRRGGAAGTRQLRSLLPLQVLRRRPGVRAHDAARLGASGAAPASSPPAAGVVAAVGVSPAGRPAWAQLGAGRAGCAAGGGTKGRLPVVANGVRRCSLEFRAAARRTCGKRARDAGAGRPRVPTAAGAVELAARKFPPGPGGERLRGSWCVP